MPTPHPVLHPDHLIREPKPRRGRRAAHSLQQSHPFLVEQWHPTLNLPLTPDTISHGSDTPIWWACPLSPSHIWQQPVHSRTKYTRIVFCPFCQRTKRGTHSQQYPELLARWNPQLNHHQEFDTTATHGICYHWNCLNNAKYTWIATLTDALTGCPGCTRNGIHTFSYLELAIRFLRQRGELTTQERELRCIFGELAPFPQQTQEIIERLFATWPTSSNPM